MQQNAMRTIKIEKLTLNFGAGKDQNLLIKGVLLLKHVTGIDPVKTVTQKRIPAWGLRPGLPIGAKITLRGSHVHELIKRLLAAREYKLKSGNFDENGNVSFGIKEYVEIPGVKYSPEIGILGFQATVTLERPGFRVKRRKLKQVSIPLNHRIPRQEAIGYMQQNFGAKIDEE
jgi:large subunit ribosomal protein L5